MDDLRWAAAFTEASTIFFLFVIRLLRYIMSDCEAYTGDEKNLLLDFIDEV